MRIPLDVETRRLRITLKSPGAGIAEIALYEHAPEAWRALLARREADARARAERDEDLRRAREELPRRPWVEVEPFGRLRVVDEVDCGAAEPGHAFAEGPPGASEVQEVLGRRCRVLRRTEGEAAWMAFPLGRR